MNEITLEVTRVVLAIGVFAIGVELPKQYMKRHWKSLFFLLVPIMTYGWFVSAGLFFSSFVTFLFSLIGPRHKY
jgi:sodium/hydrogen antiporter